MLLVSVETGEVVQSVSPPLGQRACVTAVASGGEASPDKLYVGDSDGYGAAAAPAPGGRGAR